MRTKAVKICGIALGLGIFGAFFRWLQNIGGFEKDTGLEILGAWQSWVMIAFLLASAVALYFTVRCVREMSIPGEYPANIARFKPFYTIAAGLVALLMLIGGALTALGSRGSVNMIFELILGLLAIAAAICSFLLFFRAKTPTAKGGLFSSVLVVFACFWLIATYKDSSNDPVLWHFAIEILAISATILGLYYFAGSAYKKFKPFPTVFFCLLGAVLDIVTIADDGSVGAHLLFAAAALLLLLLTFAMLNNGDAAKPVEDGTGESAPPRRIRDKKINPRLTDKK